MSGRFRIAPERAESTSGQFRSAPMRDWIDEMLRIRAMALAVGVLATAPATAMASSVGIESGQAVFRSGATSADASTFETYTFRDAAEPLIAKPGCFPTVDGVQCPQARTQVFLLGGGNDRLYAHSGLASEVLADGAAGHDDIDVDATAGTTASGGAGDDTIRVGAHGGVSATGDGGDDHLLGNGASSDLSGGGGDDLLVDVGGGIAARSPGTPARTS